MRDPLIIGLDTPDLGVALEQVQALKGQTRSYKVGLEFVCANGPDGVLAILQEEIDLFLDLKLYDIPHTVEMAARQLGRLGVKWVTVHLAGGVDMVKAAVNGLQDGALQAHQNIPQVIGVSVVTSFTQSAWQESGNIDKIEDRVLHLSHLATMADCVGMVASAQELSRLRSIVPPAFSLVVPGIRQKGDVSGDQARVATPTEAMASGADYLVVSRPILQALNPVAKAKSYLEEIKSGVKLWNQLKF